MIGKQPLAAPRSFGDRVKRDAKREPQYACRVRAARHLSSDWQLPVQPALDARAFTLLVVCGYDGSVMPQAYCTPSVTFCQEENMKMFDF